MLAMRDNPRSIRLESPIQAFAHKRSYVHNGTHDLCEIFLKMTRGRNNLKGERNSHLLVYRRESEMCEHRLHIHI